MPKIEFVFIVDAADNIGFSPLDPTADDRDKEIAACIEAATMNEDGEVEMIPSHACVVAIELPSGKPPELSAKIERDADGNVRLAVKPIPV